jgi:hypothetical protein
MVEGFFSFFSKTSKKTLRDIQVQTLAELDELIYLYFKDVDEESVAMHWKYNIDDIDISDEIIVDALPL